MSDYAAFSRQLAERAPDGPLLLAFSGGLDSTVLLSLLHHAGLAQRLRAVHIDHQLQAGSVRWAEHCLRVAESVGVPCQPLAVTVDLRDGLEAGARHARYQALFANAAADGATLITAHHRDDQAETLLLRLLRGSGVQGLAAMREWRRQQGVGCWRPLLGISRRTLELWAAELGLVWQEDPSNQDQRLRRNYLRHGVLPLLRERWDGVDEVLVRTAEHMSEAAELLRERAAEDAAAAGVKAGSFPLGALPGLSLARQRNLLRWWLQQRGARAPSAAVLDQLLALQDSPLDSQAQVAWGAWATRLFRGALYLLPRTRFAAWQGSALWREAEQPPDLPHWRWHQDAEDDAVPVWRPAGDLLLQPFAGGERLLRNGMHQRVKELWRVAAVPPWQRHQWPLLYRAGTLVSVPAVGAADGEQQHGEMWFLSPKRHIAD